MVDQAVSRERPGPPPSATSFALNCVALLPVLATLLVLRREPYSSMDDMLLLVAAASVPIVLLDVAVLRIHRRASTGLDWDSQARPDHGRIATKLVGLAFTLGLIAFAYWLFPEYHGSFYDPLWSALRRFWSLLGVLAVAYVWIVDGRMRVPRDAYWQLGRLVLGRRADARSAEIANHFRGWLVKAYFFPLMFVWLHNSVHELISISLADAAWSNLRAYDYLYTLVFGLDLLFTTAGYALSLKAIDTHVRTAEPTMYGWAVALFCYQPFFSLMEGQYVAYAGNVGFGGWLADFPVFRWVWAIVILLLLTIYTLATVAFGVRFSNLTHRGILTGGPYRFSKHPAYLSKNLSWWLIAVPFLHSPPVDAVRHFLSLGCINAIYFLRARTEERHLSRDPSYVAYALWINDHGLLRSLGRRIALLRYQPPTAEPPVAPK